MRLAAAFLDAPEVRAVLAALTSTGAPARFVGGCVRDALLGVEAADLDIATPLLPAAARDVCEAAGLRVVPTGLAHGTVTVWSGGRAIEVTTLRRDVETDGRHAVVAFTGDWAADAARRDFTINALYAGGDGTLFDPLGGGLADLRAGRVRFIGQAAARIAEDYLRILRFFRFHARFARGAPDAQAMAAIGEARDGLARLSGERVRDELLKILALARAPAAVCMMRRAGVLACILPGAPARCALKALVAVEAAWAGAEPLRRLCCLAGRSAAPLAALKLSNAERRRIDGMIAAAAALGRPDPKAARALAYRLSPQAVLDAAALHAAEGQAPAWRAMAQALHGWTPPALPLAGGDVTQRGVAPGREVGRLLALVESWWLAGDMAADRAACLAELERHLAEKG